MAVLRIRDSGDHRNIYLLFILFVNVFVFINCTELRSNCRKVNDHALKNITLSTFSGKWNVLYSNYPEHENKCSHLVSRADGNQLTTDIHSEHWPNATLQLVQCIGKPEKFWMNYKGARAATVWFFFFQHKYYALYVCRKETVNNKTIAYEKILIISREKTIPEVILHEIEEKLDDFANHIQLKPVKHNDCGESKSLRQKLEKSLTKNRTQKLAPIINKNCKNVTQKESAVDFDYIQGEWSIEYANAESEDKECVKLTFEKHSEDSNKLTYLIHNNDGKFRGELTRSDHGKGLTDGQTSWHFIKSDNFFIIYLCTNSENGENNYTIETFLLLVRNNRDGNAIKDRKRRNLFSIIDKIANQHVVLKPGYCRHNDETVKPTESPVPHLVHKYTLNLSDIENGVYKDEPVPDIGPCPKAHELCRDLENVRTKTYDFKNNGGIWYITHSLENRQCFTMEIERRQTNSNRKWYTIRKGLYLIAAGILHFNKDGTMSALNTREHKCAHILSYDDSHFATISCYINGNLSVEIFSRKPTLNKSVIPVITEKLSRTGVRFTDLHVNQHHCPKTYDHVKCPDMSADAMKNVDLKRYSGLWYAHVTNRRGLRCVKIDNYARAMAEPNQTDYWYNVIDNTGLAGWGRIRLKENGQLTQITSASMENRLFYIFDTGYANYHIYYACSIKSVDYERRKIEDYGILSRKPTLESGILKSGKNILTKHGLNEQYDIDQQNCHYADISHRPALNDYHCINVDKFVKKFNISEIGDGQWTLQYSNRFNSNDCYFELFNDTKNYALRYDDTMQFGSIICDKTGYKLHSDDPTIGTFDFHVLDTDYETHVIVYACHEFDGSLTKIEGVFLYTRDCCFHHSLVNRTKELANTIGYNGDIHKVTQYKCNSTNNYGSKILSDGCRRLNENELIDVNFGEVSGKWQLKMSSPHHLSHYYHYNINTNESQHLLHVMQYVNDIRTGEYSIYHLNNSRLLRRDMEKGLRGMGAYLYLDSDYRVSYVCDEIIENGTIKAQEILRVATRDSAKDESTKTLERKLMELPSNLKYKIHDLIESIKIDSVKSNATKNIAGNKYEDPQVIKDFMKRVEEIEEFKRNVVNESSDTKGNNLETLNKVCTHFDEDELYTPHLENVRIWQLNYAAFINVKNQFDSVLTYFHDDKLDITLYYGSKIIGNGQLTFNNGSKSLSKWINGVMSRDVYLYSDNDYRIIHTCRSNGSKGEENIYLMTHFHTNIPHDLSDFLKILNENVQPSALKKINHLIEHLKPAIKKHDTELNHNDKCKSIDNAIDVDLSKIAGHWDGVMTSDPIIDNTCLTKDLVVNDTFLLLTKMNNKELSNSIIAKAIDSNRLTAFVGRIAFHLWIVATDYSTYKLAYICRTVMRKDGTKHKFEMMRLYTRGIEITELNKTIVNDANQNAATLGLTLSVINRADCVRKTNESKEFLDINESHVIASNKSIYKSCRKLRNKCVKDYNYDSIIGDWGLHWISDDIFINKCANLTFSRDANNAEGLKLAINAKNVVELNGHVSPGKKGAHKINFRNPQCMLRNYIMDTDHETYILSYSCGECNYGDIPLDFTAIFVRNGHSIDENTTNPLINRSAENGLNLKSTFRNCNSVNDIITKSPDTTPVSTESPKLSENSTEVIKPDNSSPIVNKCRNLKKKCVRDVDFNQLMGKWEVIYSSIPSYDSCSNITLSKNENGTFQFLSEFQFEIPFSGQMNFGKSGAQIISYDKNRYGDSKHYILDTDYDTYLMGYYCGRVAGTKRLIEFVRILTRPAQTIDNDTLTDLIKRAEDIDFKEQLTNRDCRRTYFEPSKDESNTTESGEKPKPVCEKVKLKQPPENRVIGKWYIVGGTIPKPDCSVITYKKTDASVFLIEESIFNNVTREMVLLKDCSVLEDGFSSAISQFLYADEDLALLYHCGVTFNDTIQVYIMILARVPLPPPEVLIRLRMLIEHFANLINHKSILTHVVVQDKCNSDSKNVSITVSSPEPSLLTSNSAVNSVSTEAPHSDSTEKPHSVSTEASHSVCTESQKSQECLNFDGKGIGSINFSKLKGLWYAHLSFKPYRKCVMITFTKRAKLEFNVTIKINGTVSREAILKLDKTTGKFTFEVDDVKLNYWILENDNNRNVYYSCGLGKDNQKIEYYGFKSRIPNEDPKVISAERLTLNSYGINELYTVDNSNCQ